MNLKLTIMKEKEFFFMFTLPLLLYCMSKLQYLALVCKHDNQTRLPP